MISIVSSSILTQLDYWFFMQIALQHVGQGMFVSSAEAESAIFFFSNWKMALFKLISAPLAFSKSNQRWPQFIFSDLSLGLLKTKLALIGKLRLGKKIKVLWRVFGGLCVRFGITRGRSFWWGYSFLNNKLGVHQTRIFLRLFSCMFLWSSRDFFSHRRGISLSSS